MKIKISEITKKSISNVYIPNNNNSEDNDPETLSKNPINEKIDKEILERYKVEECLPRYIRTALIEGAKPVLVFPYQDILDMAKISIKNFSTKYGDFKFRTEKSNESFENLISEFHSRDHRLLPNFNDVNFAQLPSIELIVVTLPTLKLLKSRLVSLLQL